jgi:hypothetical protein
MNLAPQLQQAIVGTGRRQELQTSADRLGDAGATGMLGLLQKLGWDFHRDFAIPVHDVVSTPSSPRAFMVPRDGSHPSAVDFCLEINLARACERDPG